MSNKRIDQLPITNNVSGDDNLIVFKNNTTERQTVNSLTDYIVSNIVTISGITNTDGNLNISNTGATYEINLNYSDQTSITNIDGNLQITNTGTTYEINSSGITENTNNIITLQSDLNNKYDKSGGTISGDVTITGQTYFQNSVYFEPIQDLVPSPSVYTCDLSQSNIFILRWQDAATLSYSNPQIGTYIWIIYDQTTLSDISFDTNKFATPGGTIPTLTATLGATDIINGVYNGNEMIISIGNDIQVI